ncbi:putative germin-like protein 2-1 [Macadamia integrifolia]|uniref:putative germin-like protein 2-1 n=1 Tax=Macadamia integrifolia TaxID=60698 RepID=UPI001C529079|nr:putative germin-like protein 2-1 [Macadamia integrifolia]
MTDCKMEFQCFVAFVIFAALASSLCYAYDPSPLQDICVAIKDPSSAVMVNGKFCKDSKLATADDFFFTGLNIPRNPSNSVGSQVTPVFADQLPGLNTLGVALARIDFAPYGLNPPHTHPRATEILTVLEGSLYVGFVTSDPDYRLVSKVLNKGDVFVFPIGLIHFQQNVGHTSAVAISGFGSQSPGLIVIGNTVFGSKPPISDDALAKAFQVDKKVVDEIQAKFAMPK